LLLVGTATAAEMDWLVDGIAAFSSGDNRSILLSVLTVALSGAFAWRYRRLYRKAMDENDNTRELIEHLSEGVYRSSIDGSQISANRALVKLNGYEEEEEMLASVSDIAAEWYVDPTRRDQFREILHQNGYVEDFVSEIFRHKTRERIWITESARIVYDKKTGKPLHYEGSVREITETIARLKLEEKFRKLTSHLPGGLFQLTANSGGVSKIDYLSEGFHRIAGIPLRRHYDDASLFHSFVHPEDREAYVDAFRNSNLGLTPIDHEFRIRTADGQEKWLRMCAQPEAGEGCTTWYGYVSDISLRKRQALEIEKLAYFDPLTQLPNRRFLVERISAAVGECGRNGRKSLLFFIDLDNFKILNDTQGHDVGDAYLREIAERLKGCVRDTDTIARMGGDEFILMIEDVAGDQPAAEAMAAGAANDMLAALRRPFELGEIRHSSSASIGVVVFDGTERRVDEILKRADIAMYQAKSTGRDSAALFDPSLMECENERYVLVGDLRKAIADETLELHYQPQIDRTGKIVGAEALLRWNHPVLGPVSPLRIIPLAEQSGLIGSLCRFVLKTAIRKLAEWSERPETSQLRLAVNVSVKTFGTSGVVRFVEDLVAASNIDASLLTIEFAESVTVTDNAAIASRMRALKEMGIRFSLDDFGSGFSSLARLKKLPFDEVKIDGGFVTDIENSESDRALVRTILAMANTLHLEVVAEHVETKNQEAFLHAFGCDCFQGFLYSAALPATEFETMILSAISGTQGPEHLDQLIA